MCFLGVFTNCKGDGLTGTTHRSVFLRSRRTRSLCPPLSEPDLPYLRRQIPFLSLLGNDCRWLADIAPASPVDWLSRWPIGQPTQASTRNDVQVRRFTQPSHLATVQLRRVVGKWLSLKKRNYFWVGVFRLLLFTLQFIHLSMSLQLSNKITIMSFIWDIQIYESQSE